MQENVREETHTEKEDMREDTHTHTQRMWLGVDVPRGVEADALEIHQHRVVANPDLEVWYRALLTPV